MAILTTIIYGISYIHMKTIGCMTVYMYAYNVLLTNTCNMYEIKILLLLLLLLL